MMSKYIVIKDGAFGPETTPELLVEVYDSMNSDDQDRVRELMCDEPDEPGPPDEAWVNVYHDSGTIGYAFDSEGQAQNQGTSAKYAAVSYLRRDAVMATIPKDPERYAGLNGLCELLGIEE